MKAPIIGRMFHLSDLHFTANTLGKADLKASPLAAPPSAFDTRPFDDLFSFARTHQAGLLIASGDFINATSFTKQRFSWFAPSLRLKLGRLSATSALNPRLSTMRSAVSFLNELAAELGIADPKEQVLVCPGNHDTDWDEARIPGRSNCTTFLTETAAFARPEGSAEFKLLPDLGLCLLILNTSKLGGTAFRRGTGTTYEDAPAVPVADLDAALRAAALKFSMGLEFSVPAGLLGVVVSHHPLTSVQAPTAEIKPYEGTIAGEQAKEILARAGFRLFLHGHKHVSVAVEQTVHRPGYSPQHVVLAGAPAFAEEGGFHVIDYAVSPETGEARISVRRFRNESARPVLVGSPLCFAISPRERSAVRCIRVVERINEHGDTRTDVTFSELTTPVEPPEPAVEAFGWHSAEGAWERRFRRELSADGSWVGDIVARSLTSNAEVEFERDVGDTGEYRCGFIRVRAGGGVTTSFMERSWSSNVYGVTVGHQLRVGAKSEMLPDLRRGEEALVYMMRDPADLLELFIRVPVPYALSARVSVRTYVEKSRTALVLNARLLDFSAYHVEDATFAKRLRISIRKPLVGVAYAVVWPLPHEPQKLILRPGDVESFTQALAEAEELRERLLRMRDDAELQSQFEKTYAKLATILAEHQAIIGDGALECGVYVPDESLVRSPDAVVDRAKLVSLCATFKSTKNLWEKTWPVGHGVAGRSFALNQVVRYRLPIAPIDESVPDQWTSNGVPIYVPFGGPAHTTLYATPLTHPKRSDVLFGVVTIGVRHAPTVLRLELPGPDGETCEAFLAHSLRAMLVDMASQARPKI